MARHRSSRSKRNAYRAVSTVPAFPAIPGTAHSRSTYRHLYRQPRPGTHQRPVRLGLRGTREHIRRNGVHHAHGAALGAHWDMGFPGGFWWRLN